MTTSSLKPKPLKVAVAGGTLRNIVVQVKSRSGRLLGTGTLASLSRATRPVTVFLRAPLKPGTYRATASGGDGLGHTVRATRRDFPMR